MEPRMQESFSQCVGFSSSEAQGHLHTLSLWNRPLVAAPGRAQWCLYQPVKRDSPGLHQVPLSQSNSPQSTDGCSFTSTLPLRGGAPGHDAQSPNQMEQTPIAGVQATVQHNFGSNHVYLKREYLPSVYYHKDRMQVKHETHLYQHKLCESLKELVYFYSMNFLHGKANNNWVIINYETRYYIVLT